MKVAKFIVYLSARGLVDPAKIPEDSNEGFFNRANIQNCAFLARSFGLDMGYVFDGHLYGPFSVGMARDYNKMHVSNAARASAPAPPGLRSEEFLSAVGDKSPEWLGIAASIMQITGENPRVTPRVMHAFKCIHAPEFIDSVYRDLYDLGLMPIRRAD